MAASLSQYPGKKKMRVNGRTEIIRATSGRSLAWARVDAVFAGRVQAAALAVGADGEAAVQLAVDAARNQLRLVPGQLLLVGAQHLLELRRRHAVVFFEHRRGVALAERRNEMK